MTSTEFAKQLADQMISGMKKADEINAANGLKPYSNNPLDDIDWDEDIEQYLIPGDPNAF